MTVEQTLQGTVQYTYDAAGRRTSMTVSNQANPVTYSYDNANRLIQIVQGSNLVSIGYDGAGRRASLTLSSGIVASYSYDAANQLTGIAYANGSNVIGNLTYGYDQNGNRVEVGGTLASTNLPGALSAASYNADNQLQQWGAATFTYDLNGNMTGDGTNNYSWDARNQLASITGSVLVTPQYDAFERRILNPASQSLLYDGDNIVQEQASNGTVSANLLTGLGIDEHFLWSDSTGDHSFLTDALGSTLALTDSNANVTTQYSYDPFGGTNMSGTSFNSFEYTGRENDGTGLYYYRARYYDPTIERFISEDPIRFTGGINFYRYVLNNPENFVDPFGLQSYASSYAGYGAVGGAGVAALGSVVVDAGTGGVNIIATPAEIGAGAAVGAAIGYGVGAIVDIGSTFFSKSNPFTGTPGSTSTTTQPDGSPKQTRRYGSDGFPETDVDHDHPDHHPGVGSPHAHDWGRRPGCKPTKDDRGPGRSLQPGDPRP